MHPFIKKFQQYVESLPACFQFQNILKYSEFPQNFTTSGLSSCFPVTWKPRNPCKTLCVRRYVVRIWAPVLILDQSEKLNQICFYIWLFQRKLSYWFSRLIYFKDPALNEARQRLQHSRRELHSVLIDLQVLVYTWTRLEAEVREAQAKTEPLKSSLEL